MNQKIFNLNSNNSENDPNDQEEIKIVYVLECLKLDSCKVQVLGNIVGRSEPYKVVSVIQSNWDCGEDTKSFNPPIFILKEFTCYECHKTIKNETSTYQNTVTVHLQDSEKFNDIDKLTCILLDIDTENIKIGEKVAITGGIHIKPKYNKESLVPIVFANQLEYENNNGITINENDVNAGIFGTVSLDVCKKCISIFKNENLGYKMREGEKN